MLLVEQPRVDPLVAVCHRVGGEVLLHLHAALHSIDFIEVGGRLDQVRPR